MESPVSKGKTSLWNNPMTITIIVVFVAITIWWLFIHPFDGTVFVDQKNIWSSSYELICILGGFFGLVASKYWGGYKSVVGRVILAFSVGLFLQAFGQTVYNYYTLVSKIETPYPSLGDVGYFGSVIAYIYGALILARASGIKFLIRSNRNKLVIIIFPIAMLLLSYWIFLSNYQFTGQALTTFLDFGYPLGQAIYVSIALLVVYLARSSYLGGLMRKPIILLLVALIIQYISDFDFLYQANHNLWYAGSLGDYMYAISYFVMTMALIYISYIGKTRSDMTHE